MKMKKTNDPEFLSYAEYWIDKEVREYKNFLYGTVPLLPLHVGFDPISALISDLLKKKLSPIIILADSYAQMEKGVSYNDFEYLKIVEYYKFFFEMQGVPKTNILLHSEAFHNPAYWNLVMNLGTNFSKREMFKAIPQLQRQEDLKMNKYLHILFQTADVKYYEADLVIGYESQRRIYVTSMSLLKKAGYKSPGCILIAEQNDLLDRNLNESTSETRISYHDNSQSLERKFKKVKYDKKSVLERLYAISLYPFLEKETQKTTGYSKDDLVKVFQTITKKEFDKLKSDAIKLFSIRFMDFEKKLGDHPHLTEWIDLPKIRGEINEK